MNTAATDHLIHRPRLLRGAVAADADDLTRLRQDPRTLVTDTFVDQVRDLVRARHPAERLPAEALEALVMEHLHGAKADDAGTWAWYPWSHRLVHVLDEAELVELRTDRNRHKITPDEQHVLATKTVLVVGLSAGGAVALTIALERGCGHLRLADFDRVDLSNLNRLRAGIHEIGVPKTVVAARAIAELDPYLRVSCFDVGYRPELADELFDAVDLVVEECDDVAAKVDVRLEARRRGVPVVMATSDSGATDVERFDLEPDRPLFHGALGDLDPDRLRRLPREERIAASFEIARVDELSPRLRASIVELGSTISTWPQLGSDVALGGAVVAALARRILLAEDVPSGRSYVESHAAPAGINAGAARAAAPGQPVRA